MTTAAGPFAVTAPNTAVTWPSASAQTVDLERGRHTAVAPVNCANVDILLSTDGGHTFPTTLAAGTPNDGAQSVTIPNLRTTTTARVKVACSNNVFFDISNVDFKVIRPRRIPRAPTCRRADRSSSECERRGRRRRRLRLWSGAVVTRAALR